MVPRLAVAVVVVGLSALLVMPAVFANPAPPSVDLFGYYFFDGGAPRGFTDVDHLHLSTIDMKDGKMVTVPLHGFIRMKRKGKALAVDYELVDLKLDGKKLSFTTKAIGGIRYGFTGAFLKLGDFPQEPPEGVVLQGHLVKINGETKAAEADVRFAYEAGG